MGDDRRDALSERHETVSDRLSSVWADDAWRYAIVAGGCSIPAVLALGWVDVGGQGYLVPVAVGVLVGCWSARRAVSSLRVGFLAGLVGGLGLLYPVARFGTLIQYDAQPAVVTASMVIALLFVTALYVGLFGVLGAIGGRTGAWLRTTIVAR